MADVLSRVWLGNLYGAPRGVEMQNGPGARRNGDDGIAADGKLTGRRTAVSKLRIDHPPDVTGAHDPRHPHVPGSGPIRTSANIEPMAAEATRLAASPGFA